MLRAVIGKRLTYAELISADLQPARTCEGKNMQAKTRPKEPEREGRIDSVRPPESLPDASPLERMTELTRRVIGVPKTELTPKPASGHGKRRRN